MRIIEQLNQYDENLTLFKVKALILEKEQKERQKEEREFEYLQNKFKNTYIKIIDNHSLFGRTVEIYHIEEIIRKERTQDWNFIYYFKGTKISFSKRDINFVKIKGNTTHWSFSKEELEQTQIIDKHQYKSYLKQYEDINDKLNQILQ